MWITQMTRCRHHACLVTGTKSTMPFFVVLVWLSWHWRQFAKVFLFGIRIRLKLQSMSFSVNVSHTSAFLIRLFWFNHSHHSFDWFIHSFPLFILFHSFYASFIPIIDFEPFIPIIPFHSSQGLPVLAVVLLIGATVFLRRLPIWHSTIEAHRL